MSNTKEARLTRRDFLKAGPLLAYAAGRGIKELADYYFSQFGQGQVGRFHEEVSLTAKESFSRIGLSGLETFCTPGTRPYSIGFGDTLIGIAQQSGLASPIQDEVEILKEWNPGLAYIDPNIIYPGDKLALPETRQTLEFLAEKQQLPYPGAPKDLIGWLRQEIPGVLTELEDRSTRAVAVGSGNARVSKERSEVRDIIVFFIHGQGRPFSRANIFLTLSEYQARFLMDPYNESMFEEYRIEVKEVNNLLQNSGVAESLPQDIQDKLIFKPVSNDVGGGGTFGQLRPFVFLHGAYDSQSWMTEVMQRDTRNVWIRTAVHESLHNIQPLIPLETHQSIFTHVSMGMVTLAAEDTLSERFVRWDAVDPRSQWVWEVLTETMGSKKAYRMLVQAAAGYKNLKEIETLYNQRKPDQAPTFNDLFLQEGFWETGNPQVDDFVRKYIEATENYVRNFESLHSTVESVVQ